MSNSFLWTVFNLEKIGQIKREMLLNYKNRLVLHSPHMLEGILSDLVLVGRAMRAGFPGNFSPIDTNCVKRAVNIKKSIVSKVLYREVLYHPLLTDLILTGKIRAWETTLCGALSVHFLPYTIHLSSRLTSDFR